MTAFDAYLLLSPAPTEVEAAAGVPTGPAHSAYAQAQTTQQMERAWQWTLNMVETRLGPLQRQRLEAAWRSRAAPWLKGLTLPTIFQPSNLPTFQRSNLSLRRQAAAWACATALVLNLLAPPLLALAAGPTPQGGEFQVNSYTTNIQRNPNVALDADGDFVVAWSSYSQDGSGDGIYVQHYNAAGLAQGDEFRVNSYTSGNQRFPSVALDADGDFVVAWESYGQDGSGFGVYARRYNAAGIAQGGEFQVNSYTTSGQFFPSVALDADGDFVVAWSSYTQDGSGFGVYAQRYNATDLAQGGEFQVNTYTTNSQLFPSVALDTDGDFVVTWNSYSQDGSNYGVYAQRYNAAGLAQGGEFQVNTYTTVGQASPSVALDADGDFVVAWRSNDQDGDGYGIYAQRYNATGLAQGGEFRVNTYTTDRQRNPSVALDAAGDFVVAWNSLNQDGGNYGVYAQRYNAAGLAQGTEFRVNTYTTSNQSNPSVALDADGDFVVAWQSIAQDGSIYGIYAQRYAVASPTLALTKTASLANPTPGQALTYILTISNSGLANATAAVISDTLPTGLTFAGPVSLTPAQPGAVLGSPPNLASNLVITAGQAITLTFPVTVTAASGQIITNTAAVTSSETLSPQTGSAVITISQSRSTYLPLILKIAP